MAPSETYRKARGEGMSTADACHAVRAAHPEITMDAVTDLCWRIETGQPEPKWIDAEGNQTAASVAWDRGFERKHHS